MCWTRASNTLIRGVREEGWDFMCVRLNANPGMHTVNSLSGKKVLNGNYFFACTPQAIASFGAEVKRKGPKIQEIQASGGLHSN